MSEPTLNSQPASSPKKFFRALNVSPFRQSTSRRNPALQLPNAESLRHTDPESRHPHDAEPRHQPFSSPAASFSHSRSHSHDSHNTFTARNYNPSYRSPHHSRQNSLSTNWKTLIPPVPHAHLGSQLPSSTGSSLPSTPTQSSSNALSGSNLKLPLGQRNRSKSPPSNRHTIAVSPNAPFHMPDMLQPSENLFNEGTFVLKRRDDSYFSSADRNATRPPASMPPVALEEPQRLHTYPEKSHASFNPFHPSSNPFQHSSKNLGLDLNFASPVPARTQAPGGPPSEHQSFSRPAINLQLLQRAIPTQSSLQLSIKTINNSQFQALKLSPSLSGQSLRGLNQSNPPSRKSSRDQSRQPNEDIQKPLSGSRKRKICYACQEVINGQFVRALNRAYHIDCFKCHECGAKCSAKFFPYDITSEDGTVNQVPLCEYDYFKKLDLICFSCDNALRGPYITALGNKYHLEHFKCSACGKVFESDESYYEHENNIYCHFHYSKLFATKCEGCQSSIIKQFVELFKSGKNQQWHPECYMVFKFWNVNLTPDCVGLPDTLSVAATTLDISPKDLMLVELKIETVVLRCWITLSGFEETSASCISEMLLSACTGKRLTGLHVSAKLILFLEILFKGLDLILNMCLEFKPEKPLLSDSKIALIEEIYSVDAFDKFLTLRKEPRSISGKLMSYLAILRKSNQISGSGSLSAELLSVITGCAHYLKLLIRIGLSNALKLNKLRCDTKALDGFLGIIKTYEEIESPDKMSSEDQEKIINARLAVKRNATDSCKACLKSIEKACVLFGNTRWHIKCFECSNCQRKPSAEFKIESYLHGADDTILCAECAVSHYKVGVGYSSGFVRVSDLSQLAYLLKIAIFRSKSAIKKDTLAANEQARTGMSHILEEPSETETTYSKTLDEVTLLRKKRESQKLCNSVKKNARKSVIIEAPEAATARADNTMELEPETPATRKESTSSNLSYIPLASGNDTDEFDFQVNQLKIRDEPQQRNPSNSLNRTSDLLKNEKSLTLDDIPRIVAAEQAREQRPNAFKHHNSLYQKKSQQIQSVLRKAGNGLQSEQANQVAPTSQPATELKHKYFSELTAYEHKILRFVAIEAFLEICSEFTREELWNLVLPKKQGTFWDKFKFGGNNDKGKMLPVFGSDLKEVTKKYGVDSSLGVGPSQLRIPIVVDDVIQALRQKDMSVEGIFRLNGNIKNLRELTTQINNAPLKSPVFNNYSAVQLAALMKKWLRELPNPLLTFKLYDLWILSRKAGSATKRKRVLQLVCCMLPRSHRNLLEVLLYFFSWVASFADIDEETGSKMDTHNLATVIAPNILLSKASTNELGENQSSDAHFLAIEVVNQLIENQEDLAVIPSDLWEFYEKCQFPSVPKDGRLEAIAPKDITTKINQTLKSNPKYFSDQNWQDDAKKRG